MSYRDQPGASPAEQPLHVAFFAPELPDSGLSNGIVTYVRIMRDTLRALGHAVTTVTLEQIEHANGAVTKLPKAGPLSTLAQALSTRKLPADGSHPSIRRRLLNAFLEAKRCGADIFEIEESFGWVTSLTGRGVAVVERLHGPHVFGREPIESQEQAVLSDLREAAELASFRKVQAVTSPSQRLLSAIEDRYQLELPIARTIANPMPLVEYSPRRRAEQAVPNQILCVGRFDLRKGADVVLRAFAAAHERSPELKLLMVGPDTGLRCTDGRLIHFDDFIATELAPEVRTEIRFLGTQPPGQIAALRAECGMAVVGSRFESFAYTIAEAMAAGMPVVSTDTFAAPELIRNGVDGRIVPIGDVSEMANAIVAMVRDPAKLVEMGRSAYARAADLLCPDKIARQTIAVYRAANSAS
jgi:glycosyltransferase involved in cell wall biosynthesis